MSPESPENHESPYSKKEWLNPNNPSCTAYVMTECGLDEVDGNWDENVLLEMHDGDNTPLQIDRYLRDRDDALVVLDAIATVRRALDRIEAYVRLWHEAWRFCPSGIILQDTDGKEIPHGAPLPKSEPTF